MTYSASVLPTVSADADGLTFNYDIFTTYKTQFLLLLQSQLSSYKLSPRRRAPLSPPRGRLSRSYFR
ncbi:unnamed protein product [Lactuca virosa]|uniref:Uncharacterized protein n=1 Tax=Lactuca virosa TaxID=75947 RepID=A0AAU9NFB8_9ASTR|nr:unnamed protein product [Lactuca virosa]